MQKRDRDIALRENFWIWTRREGPLEASVNKTDRSDGTGCTVKKDSRGGYRESLYSPRPSRSPCPIPGGTAAGSVCSSPWPAYFADPSKIIPFSIY